MNGTIELDTITNCALCYTAGSRILTVRGEVPVQELPVGDLADGVLRQGCAPFQGGQMIGCRVVDLALHPRWDPVRPVRIKADVIAEVCRGGT
jgi:hypothetical protein